MQHRLFHKHLHTHDYCNTIYNSQVIETAKIGVQERRTGTAHKWEEGKIVQKMYTHVSKCKKVKI
jgi:hypothetical protein